MRFAQSQLSIIIMSQRKREEKFRQLAIHDNLTGLYNTRYPYLTTFSHAAELLEAVADTECQSGAAHKGPLDIGLEIHA